MIYWLDRAARASREPIGVKPFCAAAVACGDIYIYSSFDNLPYDVSLGLADMYRAANDTGWRNVLAGGKLLVVAPPKLGGAMHISCR